MTSILSISPIADLIFDLNLPDYVKLEKPKAGIFPSDKYKALRDTILMKNCSPSREILSPVTATQEQCPGRKTVLQPQAFMNELQTLQALQTCIM